MRYCIFIFVCLILTACASTKRVASGQGSIQYTQESTIYQQLMDADYQASSAIITHIYDSVITHVTIIKYDTIQVDGKPIVKEEIHIDQAKVSNGKQEEARSDTLQMHIENDATIQKKDSIVEYRYIEKSNKDKRRDIATFILFLAVVILSFLCFRAILENK